MQTARARDAADSLSGFSKTAAVTGTITVQVSASHVVGLSKTELYIDGTLVTNSSSGRLTYR